MASLLSSSSSCSVLSTELRRNPTRYRYGLTKLRTGSPTVRSAMSRRRRDNYGYGRDRSVDESMIVLRKRIEELRSRDQLSHHSCFDDEAEAEAQTAAAPQFEWMEWEKEYYAGCYGSDVCQVVGLIQSVLMRTRPSVAIGFLAVLFLSVPTSVTLLGFHLLDAFGSLQLMN